MPIARSGTIRAKSPRSPGPTRTPLASSAPKFMPPSHYAAAGGYKTRIISQEDGYQNDKSSFPVQTPRSIPRVHLSSDSGSSVLSNTEEHAPDLTQLKGLQTGIPGLEAQLLPSLRDTIDRMTGAPSRTYTSGKDRITREKWENKGVTLRESSGRWAATPTLIEPKSRHAAARDSPSSRRAADDTPTLSYPHSQQSTPIPDTPVYRSKTPVKSALKSSLKSPATKSSNTTDNNASSFSPVPTSSLKTMKSLLTRKCSGRLMSPFTSNKVSPGSSVKEPRVVQYVSSPLQCDAPSFPRNGFQSSIPRLRTRFYNDDPNSLHNDDSDLEHRFEAESRDRRKLTVMNAEVFVSESSSESVSDLRQECAFNSRIPETPSLRYKENSFGGPVGLGLLFPRSPSTPKEPRQHRTPVAREEDFRRAITPEKNLRFSLPPSDSEGSSYSSDEFGSRHPGLSRNGGREVGDRNWKQGHSIPAGLDQAFNNQGSRCPSPQSLRIVHDEGQYFRRSSSSPASESGGMNRNEETESDREGYSIRRSRVHQRRRSSSWTPSFRMSTVPGQKDYISELPRPKSACQRRATGAADDMTRTDKDFPSGLKELIKKRQSKNAIYDYPQEVESQDYRQTTREKRRSTRGLDNGHGGKKNWEETNNTATDELDSWSHSGSPFGHSGERQQHQTEAIRAEAYHSLAARERLAFGIPPSESDEVYNKGPSEPELSHTESDMSSINESLRRQQREYEDDTKAENRLRQLDNVKDTNLDNRRPPKHTTPQLNIISPTLSSESMYDERQTNQATEYELESNLRSPEEPSSTEESAPRSRSSEFPPTREDVIQEIFETEEELLRLLHICLRTFIRPLRIQNTRSWISGIPPAVARLLDWFDDIVNLHEQIYETLCSARDTMSPATDRVSESLRWFVLKVEVYQPYLVKLADVRMEIRKIMEDRKSELGQFIRLQERVRECQGWTLDRLLMLPVKRLENYQDLFARMLDLTPKAHQDYLSTFSLSRSIEFVLKVMTEVKIREDDYDFLKTFASKIRGLTPASGLATRERRLLHSGPLQLVISDLRDLSGESVYGVSTVSKRISRSSRLLDAIGKSNYDLGKAFSPTSGSSSMAADNDFTMTNISSSPVAPSKSSWFSRLPLRRRSRHKSPSKALPLSDEAARASPDIALRTVDVHAFVFNDLVLLAQKEQSLASEQSWILSEDVGIFRPLSIARLRRRHAQEGMIISLEAAAVDPQCLNDTFDFRTSSWKVIDLLIPPSQPRIPGDGREDPHSNDHFQPWLDSIRQCSRATLKKLTFIGCPYGEGSSKSFLGSDRQLDTYLIVSSLAASGLPIPRSPSGNIPETCHPENDGSSFSSDEREERGWWSVRYQQVFREFQRQDYLNFADED